MRRLFLLIVVFIPALSYELDFWTPAYGVIGYRVLQPFQSTIPYGSAAGASKEMTRLAQQMTSLVASSQKAQQEVSDVISGHNRRMSDLARQMGDLAKTVGEMAVALTGAAREMGDLVRDGEGRAKIRSREMVTTAVNLAELAKRVAEESAQCKSKKS